MQLTNTGPEPFFEDVVNHMAAICSVPVAMIAIRDSERLWLNRAGQEKGAEAPRRSFSASEVLGHAKVVVNDVSAKAGFRSLSLPAGVPQIAAYICEPLIIEGQEVGCLYLADARPRVWGEFEISYLARSARLVAGHFEARAMLAERNHRIELERQLAETNAVYRAVISSMKAGVIVRAIRGEILTVNEAARKILGLTEGQLRSRSPGDPRWRFVDVHGRTMPRERWPAEVALATGVPQTNVVMGFDGADGAIRWIECSAIPMWSGYSVTPTSVVTTFDDITDRKAREDEFKHPTAA